MVQGYLVDTNTLDYWYDNHSRKHNRTVTRISELPPRSPLFVSVVTIGEIEYGHRCMSPADTGVQRAFRRFVTQKAPMPLPITQSTTEQYGRLRAALFKRFAPRKRLKGMRPEQLRDPITSQILGIQENDLWIAAQAMEYGLILVTSDGMARIREATSDLLSIEDWGA